jgi:selenide,water dikinase
MTQRQREILCDPQTSGGLLVMVNDADQDELLKVTREHGLELEPIGQMLEADSQDNVLISIK